MKDLKGFLGQTGLQAILTESSSVALHDNSKGVFAYANQLGAIMDLSSSDDANFYGADQSGACGYIDYGDMYTNNLIIGAAIMSLNDDINVNGFSIVNNQLTNMYCDGFCNAQDDDMVQKNNLYQAGKLNTVYRGLTQGAYRKHLQANELASHNIHALIEMFAFTNKMSVVTDYLKSNKYPVQSAAAVMGMDKLGVVGHIIDFLNPTMDASDIDQTYVSLQHLSSLGMHTVGTNLCGGDLDGDSMKKCGDLMKLAVFQPMLHLNQMDYSIHKALYTDPIL